ncbi:MAG: sodium:solute symporter [Myxococcales bacterium]|nr:sodium:solute symporter [Myxococcales bacterium]
MTVIDWLVLVATIAGIVVYGIVKTRNVTTAAGFLRGDNELGWMTVGLSVMATQASAITFLSTPGQGYEDGMRFVQFYFGLPLAMILISAVIVPIFFRLRVYTAYEYLEHRFDRRVRLLGASLFLVQRGLAAGITIYAPAIVLSTLLGWRLDVTNLVIGVIVILYTVVGGSKAVSQTQKQQMIVIMAGMFIAAAVIVGSLPEGVGLVEATRLAGALGRMNVVSFDLDPSDRYNVWSGLTGGFFLALAYFGTDQSQVQRYLSGRSIREIRLGLLFNGLFKIPMQFFILAIGVLLFVLHVYELPPSFFNRPALEASRISAQKERMDVLEIRQRELHEARLALATAYVESDFRDEAVLGELTRAHEAVEEGRAEIRQLVNLAVPKAETNDADFIFISFVVERLPAGLVGLLIAVILSAAMSSTASELSALGSTSTIDIYRLFFAPEASDRHVLVASKAFTVMWGLVAIAFATFASLIDNLIEAVNILGSLFYGTVLGIFLAAFFLPFVKSRGVFVAAVLAECSVLASFFFSDLGFLWFNVIGCLVTMVLAPLFTLVFDRPARAG